MDDADIEWEGALTSRHGEFVRWRTILSLRERKPQSDKSCHVWSLDEIMTFCKLNEMAEKKSPNWPLIILVSLYGIAVGGFALFWLIYWLLYHSGL